MLSLNEVVLQFPVESVLAPWLQRAPNDAAKQWIARNFRNWLLKSSQDLHKLPYLPINADARQKKAFEFDDLYDIRLSTQTEGYLEHILDFFDNNPEVPNLDRMTVEHMLRTADQWVKQMNKAALKEPDDPKQVKTVVTFDSDFRIVDLIGKEALQREGALMGHCVGGQSYLDFVKAGRGKIYSLRDGNNSPHATIEVVFRRRPDGSIDQSTAQIKGRRNAAPTRRYWPMLRQFFTQSNISVDADYRNIGLLRLFNPETGTNQTVTQEQFRDLVLDPANEQGQEILSQYMAGSYRRRGYGYRDDESDFEIGIFTALYGTDRLSTQLVGSVFRYYPEQAIQTVEYFGNKLTPEQVVEAFISLQGHRESLDSTYKTLLIATKPDAATIKAIVNDLAQQHGEAGPRNRQITYDDVFMVALSQVLPQIYSNMLLEGGREAIEAELQTKNDRAAGPFFVFVSNDPAPVDPDLIPWMVESAFWRMPTEAIKRIQRINYPMNDTLTYAALRGMSSGYWGSADSQKKTAALNQLLEYAQPTVEVLNAFFGGGAHEDKEPVDYNNSPKKPLQRLRVHRDTDFLSRLLIGVRKYIPNVLSQEMIESALQSIGKEDMIREYLLNEPKAGIRIQQYLFNNARSEYHSGKMQWLRSIDPSFFHEAYELLRPQTPSPDVTETKNVPDHKARKDPKNRHATKQINVTRPRTEKEMLEQHWKLRKKAISVFVQVLAPMLREPTTGINSDLNPNSPKFKTGQQVFTDMGKRKLFDVAVSMINQKSISSRFAGIRNNGHYGYEEEPTKREATQEFVDRLATLSAKSIVNLIDNLDYSQDLFAEVINNAPQRVPDIMKAQKFRQKNYQKSLQWGDLKWKNLDKNKTFEALEYVWADPGVPQGYKDDFTLKVFKRFKPAPAKLIDMLDRADSEEATRYVIKKTKNPSEPLMMFVLDNFPSLMVEMSGVPGRRVLIKTFQEDWPIAVGLMNRDLRGYGPSADSRRRKYVDHGFQSKIDKTSATYKTYAAAAATANKEDQFRRYVRQTELDEQKEKVVHYVAGKLVLNMALLSQHLNEYSASTLAYISSHDTSGDAMRLYFETFSPKKLAAVIQRNGLQTSNYHYEVPENMIKGLDQRKLVEIIRILMDTKFSHLNSLVSALYKIGGQLDDETAKIYIKSRAGHGGDGIFINDRMSDAMKDWVADEMPYQMDHIPNPTRHMVTRLFDEYGHLNKDGEVPWSFSRTIEKWFSDGSAGPWFKFRPNPTALRMIADEAKSRGGEAISITRAVYKHLLDVAAKTKTDRHASTDTYHLKPSFVPKDAKLRDEK